jgi:hypothetical protein
MSAYGINAETADNNPDIEKQWYLLLIKGCSSI